MISNKLLKTFLLGSLLISASAALTTGAILSSQEKATETNAADDYNGLYDACEAAVANKSKSQLWSALKTAANSGFHNVTYDNLLTAYKTTDVKESNPNEINDYYSNITHWSISGGGSCGSYSKEGDCYNREHSIPKSWWGGNPEKSSQGSDVYIVVPSDGYVNNRRSNMCMGEVSSPTYTSANSYSKIGPNTFSGHSGTVFEPNDEWKGDFARIHMYALVKWSGWSWQSGDGSAIFSGSESTNYGFTTYAKNLFKKWHDNDQPSTYEQKKNDAAQDVQGNRNPFVDHPEYADYIFFDKDFPSSDVSSISVSPSSKTLANGATQQLTVTAHYSDSTTSDVTSSATYVSTNRNVATVSLSGLVTAVASSGSTTINISYSGKSTSCSITASAPTPVNLTGVTASNVSVNVGETATIVPTPQPSNVYPTPTYSYSSSNTGVATVSSSGVVTGVSAGSATITVTATQNSITKTATCSATVNDAPSSASIVPTDLANSYPTSETTYTTASGIKIGAYNTANFNSKIQFKKSGGYLLNTESLSLKKLTIVGQSGSGTLTICGGSEEGPTTTKTGSSGVYDLTGCSYFKIINSSSNAVTCNSIDIEFGGSPTPSPTVSLNKNSTTLIVGGTETLVATTTGTGTLSWSTSNSSVATVNNGTVTAIAAGSATITATYGSATATCSVTVNTPAKTLTSLTYTGTPTKTTYTTSDNFEPAGITVTGHYSDGSTATISNSDIAWGKPQLAGTVTGTYGGQSVIVTGLTVTASKGTADNPFSVSEAIAAIDGESLDPSTEYYITGNYSQTVTVWSDQYKNITVDIVDPSDSTKVVRLYRMKHTSNPNIGVGDSVVAKATGDKYILYSSTTYELNVCDFVSKASHDAIELDITTMSLNVGVSSTITATASGSVTWSSSNTAVATVNNGVVTGVSEGNATITATCGSASATCTVSVIQGSVPATSYEIKSATTTYTSSIGTSDWTNTSKFTGVDSSVFTVTSTSNVRLGASGKTSDIMFYSTSASSIAEVSMSLKDSSYIVSKITVNGCSNAALEHPVMTCGNITYDSIGTSYADYDFYPLSSSFSISVNTKRVFVKTITVYVVEASKAHLAYGEGFMELTNSECASFSGVSSATWTKCQTIYNNLTTAQKTTVAGYTADNNGDMLNKAMSRYDTIVAKYGKTNYISGRTVVSANISVFGNETSASIPVIVVITLISCTAIGGYFFIRKRKEI